MLRKKNQYLHLFCEERRTDCTAAITIVISCEGLLKYLSIFDFVMVVLTCRLVPYFPWLNLWKLRKEEKSLAVRVWLREVFTRVSLLPDCLRAQTWGHPSSGGFSRERRPNQCLAETSREEEEVGSLWNKFCICDENTTQPSMAPNCWDKTHMHLFAFCFVSWTCQRIESVSISVLWMEPHCGGSPWGLFRLFPRPNEVDCRCDKPLNPLLIVTLRRRSSSGWGSWPFRTLKST